MYTYIFTHTYMNIYIHIHIYATYINSLVHGPLNTNHFRQGSVSLSNIGIGIQYYTFLRYTLCRRI